jgi:hypothetical protein
MKRINCLAAEPQFVEHLAAVWKAFPRSKQGIFWVRSQEARYEAERHGINTRLWKNRASKNVVILTAAFGDLNQAYKAGATTVLMEHGAGQTYNVKHASYAGGESPARDANTLFLVPGQTSAKKLATKHPEATIVEIGCPKLDRHILKEKKLIEQKPKVVVSFHWNCNVCPETSWAFPYFKKQILKLANSENIELYGHAHPRARKEIQSFYNNMHIPFITKFEEVLKTADVYVCDNSSTIFEAAACKIPVVLLNSPKYRKNVNHGLRFWDCANIGPQAEPTDNLEEKIFEAINPTEKQVKETSEALKIVYTVTDGTSSQLAAKTIEKELLT